MSRERQPQFVCPDCGEGFDQKSAYERHRAASHPQSALTAADLEQAIAGVSFPADKRQLRARASEHGASKDVVETLEALPDREYRDAAEVGLAFGELRSRGQVRGGGAEAPSERGGRAAAGSAPSAAAVARVLSGADFPCRAEDLRRHAQRNRDRVAEPDAVLAVIEDLPEGEYRSMADVERGVGAVR